MNVSSSVLKLYVNYILSMFLFLSTARRWKRAEFNESVEYPLNSDTMSQCMGV